NASPDWGAAGERADNPHLDLDAMDGFGPENINVDRPVPGVYRVGEHAVSGDASAVTVRLYCGGSRLEARATLGPVALGEAQFWRVADVEVLPDGNCRITSLASASGPDVSASNDARAHR